MQPDMHIDATNKFVEHNYLVYFIRIIQSFTMVDRLSYIDELNRFLMDLVGDVEFHDLLICLTNLGVQS